MKQLLRSIAPLLLLTIITGLLLTVGGCATHPDSRQISEEISQAIYPLGIDLNTLKGNTWIYHDMDPNGKTYSVRVKSIQNSFARFTQGQDQLYVGIHSFGFEELGYNVNGDLIGRTGNEEQVLIPQDGGSSTFTLNFGQFAGEVMIVSKINEQQYSVKVGSIELEMQRGIGITKVNGAVQGVDGNYELENTLPDPPVHFGE